MTNQLISEFTGNLFPRSMGRPWRTNNFGHYFIAYSVKDVEDFIEMCGETNCYMSVYSYTEYT